MTKRKKKSRIPKNHKKSMQN